MTDPTPARPRSQAPILLLSPRTVLASFVSFEALLLLYMFAGVYKGDPRFALIPVDATALFFALSVVVGSFIIVFNPIYKKGLPVIFAMVCLVTWFLVSLTWSPSQIYGPSKIFYMATLELWAVIAGALIIAPNPERVRRLFTLILLLSMWMGFEALAAYVETGGTTIADYLMLGRVCGLGALVALAAWLHGRGGMVGWLCLGLFFGLGFVLAIGGGRGPLLATGLTLLIPVGLGIRLTRRKILYSRTLLSVFVLLLGLAGSLSLYTGLTGQAPGTFHRFERLLTGVASSQLRMSDAARSAHLANWVKLWPQAPLLGHGAGSWPLLTGRPDDRSYPHNMFLEVLVEAGLVGLVFLAALFAAALRPVTLERLRRDPQALCAMMLFANSFLNAMVSGDLPDNRAVFMLIGLLALFAVTRPAAIAPAGTPRQPLDLSMARSLGSTRRRHADPQPSKTV